MIRFAYFLVVVFSHSLAVSQTLFSGTPHSDWIEVSGEADILRSEKSEADKDLLIKMAQSAAIEQTMGSSIIYGNYIKSYSNELQQYERFAEINAQFMDGVWKGFISQPNFYEQVDSLYIYKKRKRTIQKVRKQCCRVHGYAAPIKTIQPVFEYQVMDGDGNVIGEHLVSDKLRHEGRDKQTFRQGDLLIVRFRASVNGYLTIYMDNGMVSSRLLPYAIHDDKEHVRVVGGEWQSFFDLKAAPYGCRDEVDELELITDQAFDAVRLYLIFSQTPFSKDFFFLPIDDETHERVELPEGYTRPPSVDSIVFARWLQQNRIKKEDLQIAIVDLVIENNGEHEYSNL